MLAVNLSLRLSSRLISVSDQVCSVTNSVNDMHLNDALRVLRGYSNYLLRKLLLFDATRSACVIKTDLLRLKNLCIVSMAELLAQV